jgi:hypothetical protein
VGDTFRTNGRIVRISILLVGRRLDSPESNVLGFRSLRFLDREFELVALFELVAFSIVASWVVRYLVLRLIPCRLRCDIYLDLHNREYREPIKIV